MTVVVALPAPWSGPVVLAALREPVFPLYLGRMGYLPTLDIGERVLVAEHLAAAVEAVMTERPGLRYWPVTGLTGGLVVSIPARGGGARLFAVG